MDRESLSPAPSRALLEHLRAAAGEDHALAPVAYVCVQAIAGRRWAVDRIAAVFTEDDLRRPAAYMRLLMKGVARSAMPQSPRRVVVSRADPMLASDLDLPGAVVEVTGHIGDGFDADADARVIAEALWDSLPGATIDRLISALLRRRESQLRVSRATLDIAAGVDPERMRAAICDELRGPLIEIVKAAAARFDQRPEYRASVEARAELQTSALRAPEKT